MLASFPDHGRINISPAVAGELMKAAERLPDYDNKEFYSTDLQEYVRDRVRESCPDGFDRLVGAIKEILSRRPYCALVHGLQFDPGNKVFVAVNRAFGELVAPPYQKPRAQLVHYVQPTTDIRSTRGGQESERLHTDTADWETPVEMISMVCVRADRSGGGRSRVLDVDAVRGDVEDRLGKPTLDLLETEPLPWQLAPYLGGGVRWRTVLTPRSMCWRRYTIDRALDANGVRVSNAMLDTLDAFERVIAGSSGTIDFLMREGELLFADNNKTIHARTPITGGADSDRLMIRSWIRTATALDPLAACQ